MSTTATVPAAALEAAAKAAGLTLTSAEPGTDFTGAPTTRATVALAADPSRFVTLELSEKFDAANAQFASTLQVFFSEAAQRLKNPRPEVFLTLIGLPLSFGNFSWPFHGSSSGADTFIVHGEARLTDGTDTQLHSKLSASLTRTFAEVVPSLEQPFAESFVFNAVRKTFDQGQLELVKSGNRQPVPVTTRYYSLKRQIFIFNDTAPEQRHHYLAAKVFWLSHILGGGAPIWIADPRDAQYLNTTVDDLKKTAAQLAKEGLVLLESDGDWASATDTLRNQEDKYRMEVAEALAFIKPTFNEDMRAGHTNM